MKKLLFILAVISAGFALGACEGSEDTGETEATIIESEEETTEALIAIPNVTGMVSEEAMITLTDLGLRVETVFAQSTEVGQDHVISQFPAANGEMHYGETVTLYIAQPYETETVFSRTLTIRNTSFSTVSQVYIVPASQDEWGNGLMTNGAVLDIGMTQGFRLPVSENGRYDICIVNIAEDLYVFRDVLISADQSMDFVDAGLPEYGERPVLNVSGNGSTCFGEVTWSAFTLEHTDNYDGDSASAEPVEDLFYSVGTDFINTGSRGVWYLYATENGFPSWGYDRLGNSILESGEQILISLDGEDPARTYDFRLCFEDGVYYTVMGAVNPAGGCVEINSDTMTLSVYAALGGDLLGSYPLS